MAILHHQNILRKVTFSNIRASVFLHKGYNTHERYKLPKVKSIVPEAKMLEVAKYSQKFTFVISKLLSCVF